LQASIYTQIIYNTQFFRVSNIRISRGLSEIGRHQIWSQLLKSYRKRPSRSTNVAKNITFPNQHLTDTFLKNKKGNGNIVARGRLTVFTAALEKELADHIITLDNHLFGLSINDIRRLAYQIAVKNHLKNNFNEENEMAGKAWYYAFMKRNPMLSLRRPEALSLVRASAFNEENVTHFYELLTNICEQYKFTSSDIYNFDEKGVGTCQKRCPKTVAKKGKKRVSAISSADRSPLTTLGCCVSAAGNFVPPLFIFKRSLTQLDKVDQFNVNAPLGSIVLGSMSGYIDASIFVRWLHHFIEHVRPSDEKKVLLLVDGHTTHTRNLEAIELAKENGIVLLQLPAHTTHRLQPLDVGFFGPLQTHYDKAVRKFLMRNPGNPVTEIHICGLVNEAYQKCATVEIGTNSFRSCGIWPIDKEVFPREEFVAAAGILAPKNNDNVSEEGSHLTPQSPAKPMEFQIEHISPIPQNTGNAPKKYKQAQKAVELTGSSYQLTLCF
jgi:DDE superfamily endonuclease/Tc5 transposase DNA-binding domain